MLDMINYTEANLSSKMLKIRVTGNENGQTKTKMITGHSTHIVEYISPVEMLHF